MNKVRRLLYVAGFAYVVAMQYGYNKGYQRGLQDYGNVVEATNKSMERVRKPQRPPEYIGSKHPY